MKSSLEGPDLTPGFPSSLGGFESVTFWDDCSEGVSGAPVLTDSRGFVVSATED